MLTDYSVGSPRPGRVSCVHLVQPVVCAIRTDRRQEVYRLWLKGKGRFSMIMPRRRTRNQLKRKAGGLCKPRHMSTSFVYIIMACIIGTNPEYLLGAHRVCARIAESIVVLAGLAERMSSFRALARRIFAVSECGSSFVCVMIHGGIYYKCAAAGLRMKIRTLLEKTARGCTDSYPRNSFFCFLSASITAESGVSTLACVARLRMRMISIAPWIFNARPPHSAVLEPHEYIPRLLVPNRRQPRRDLVLLRKLRQPRELLVLRVDVQPELRVAGGVLVPHIGDGVVGELPEVREGGVHLGAGALEEAAAPADEEGVAGEDTARVRGVGGVGYMIAD